MKKFSVILLIAVLAMTSVFADVDAKIAGSVEAKYTIDCEEGTFGYSVPNASLTATFGFTSPAGSVVGEGLRAEVATSLTWKPSTTKYTGLPQDLTFDKIGKFVLALDSFDIKYKDVWTWNLLEAEAVGNYAKSTLDFAKYISSGVEKTSAYDDTYEVYTDNGTTFAWNGFTFAAALDGGFKNDANKELYVGVETPNFTMGEGFTLQGAGALSYEGAYKSATDSWIAAGSLKAGYQSDAMTITAATDHAVIFGLKPVQGDIKEGKKVQYDVDALLTAKFAPATVTAYFGKNVKSYNATPVLLNEFNNLFSAKAEFDLTCFHAPIKAYVAGLNLLNDARILSTEFQFTLAEKYVMKAFGLDLLGKKDYDADFDDAQKIYYKDNKEGQKIGVGTSLTFGPVVVGADVYTRLARKNVGFNATAVYKNTYFTADAGVHAEFTAKNADAKRLTIDAGITSSNLIKNAVLSLTFDSGNIFKNDYTEYSGAVKVHSAGKVVTSVKVTF